MYIFVKLHCIQMKIILINTYINLLYMLTPNNTFYSQLCSKHKIYFSKLSNVLHTTSIIIVHMLSVLYPMYELLHFEANNIILLTYDWEQLQMYIWVHVYINTYIHTCMYTYKTDTHTEYNNFIPDVRMVLY